ncbi:WD repeat protein [Ichthyophthirius multifiliis]|uniref:WD repeat protein n=1 Tax=Ichthyophthirius multifiliis TaxID=5932 RepID=G0QY61_ICHMU|nr:WD repeat protein [Ichthyophthirius multifiliis]EGR29835.1 WD repeat protein [Ichthyophthirius multifiliis]|eukprot:XP_004031071.1 WD repeat protein [Ichthyophthirius multifiliis]
MNLHLANFHQTSDAHIQLGFVFGMNSQIRTNIYFLDEEKIIYPAGHNIVQYHIQDKIQVYYYGSTDYRGISCIELSPMHRQLAVGFKSCKQSTQGDDNYENPSIIIYDTITQRKKHQLVFREEKIKYWVSIAFPDQNMESKHIVSLSGNYLTERHKEKDSKEKNLPTTPDGEIVVCYWGLSGSGKILAWVKLSLASIDAFEVSISKKDCSLFTCIGKKVFKCFKKIDTVSDENNKKNKSTLKVQCQQLNGAPTELSQDYTCHTWLQKENSIFLVVCTANGEIILCDENAEFLQVLKDSPVNSQKQAFRIECISSFGKGFIIGAKDATIFVYKGTGCDINPFEEVQKITTFSQLGDLKEHYITGLSVSPISEEKLVCSLSTNSIYQIKLKKDQLFQNEQEQIEAISLNFHSGAINGLDICARKPLIATCGKDRTIKVWNFEEKTLELSWQFNEEALCLALHPSGLHMVVCFTDKLKWMNICLHQQTNSNKQKHYKEITQFKQCREIRFSNGGQYFAAINGAQSSQLIQIFRFYTGEQPPELVFKGHQNKVKCLTWSKDDSLLASCGTDGFIYIWRIDSDQPDARLFEYPNKNIQFNCVALNIETQMIYGCANDRNLYLGYIYDQGQNTQKINQEVILNQIVFPSSHKVLFGGIQDPQRSSGAIRCILFTTKSNNKYQDYAAHDEQGIEKLRVTYDDRYLITGGRDGCVMVFQIKDRDLRGVKMQEGYAKYSEEILVTRQDLDDLKGQIDNFQSQISEFNTQNINSQSNQKDEEIKQLQERLQTSMEYNKTAYEQLEEKKKDIQKKYEEEIKIMKDKQEQEIQDLDTSYQRKVMDEVERYEKKFKFVLDHKIKELKRDIGPREDEILRMKEDTNEMDKLLKKYNSYNNYLGNAVDELYTAQELMNQQIKDQRNTISTQNTKIKRFKDDIYKAVQFIQDYQKLSENIQELKEKYVSQDLSKTTNDDKIQIEQAQQKQHLQQKVERLKRYLKQDNKIHKEYNLTLMTKNVKLISEINKLRKEVKEIQKGEGGQVNYQDRSSSKGNNSIGKVRAHTAGARQSIKYGQKLNDENNFDLIIDEKKKFLQQQNELLGNLKMKLESLKYEYENINQI